MVLDGSDAAPIGISTWDEAKQGLNQDSCSIEPHSLVETNSYNSYEGSRNDAETKDFTDENVKSVLPEEVPEVEKSSSDAKSEKDNVKHDRLSHAVPPGLDELRAKQLVLKVNPQPVRLEMSYIE